MYIESVPSRHIVVGDKVNDSGGDPQRDVGFLYYIDLVVTYIYDVVINILPSTYECVVCV